MMLLSRRAFLMGTLAALPYLYLEKESVRIRRYLVPVQDLPRAFEGFTILHLSDLHDKEYGPEGELLLALVQRERFDMVALTGDLVVGTAPSLKPALDLVAGIKKFFGGPIFSVPGNHDWRLDRGEEFNERLRQAGAKVIPNQTAVVEKGDERLQVVGIDDPVTRRARLAQAMDDTGAESPVVLLSHSPHPFPLAAKLGVDLMLCGHTHGGQLRLPLLGAAFVPAMGFFPPWDLGVFRKGKTTLIVSGGLGESGIPLRINIRPELTLATLVNRLPEAPSGWDATG